MTYKKCIVCLLISILLGANCFGVPKRGHIDIKEGQITDSENKTATNNSTDTVKEFKELPLFPNEKYDSIYQRIENAIDTNVFKSLYKMVYFDEKIPDSIKVKFTFLAIDKTKKLGFEYYYAHFIYYKSMMLTLAGDFSKAIELANESLQIYLLLNEYTEASSCYNTIGGMIASKGNAKSGKTYLRKAISYNNLEKQDPDHYRIHANHLIVYGNILLSENIADSAFSLFQEAKELAVQNGFKRQEIFCLINLGKVHKMSGNYSKAKSYLKKALNAARSTNMQTVKAVAYSHLAEISVSLNQVDSAFYFFDEGLDICKNHHSFLPIQLDLLEKKAKILAENGSSNLAFNLQLEHMNLRDSLFSLDKERKIQWIQAEFEVQQKDRDIKVLSQQTTIQALEIKQKNQAIIIGIILLLLVSIIIYFIYKQRSSNAKRLHAELEEQNRASELKALRSQMNPHFVFNALNSIQEYIVSNEKKQAGKYLTKFADLMRMYLHHSEKKTIELQEEIKALNIYLELEKLRFEESLSYSIEIGNTINEDISIPALIIQPYVENALKHGLLHKRSNRSLSITFKFNAETQILDCEILDNGIGRAKSMEINQLRNPNHKPFATKATKNRLELLNYNNDRPITEQINDLFDEQNKPIGTQVLLSIPRIGAIA